MTFGFGMPRGMRDDPYGESAGSALLDAINRSKVHLARFILDANNEDTLSVVNTRDFKGKSPLTRAVYITEEKSRQRAMNLLLQHGADPNMQDNYGRTALSYACELRHNDVVKLLMKWNIDPDLPDGLGNTPLMYCAAVGNDTAVGILLKCFRRLGLVVDRSNKEGFTALHIAAKNGFTECAARLAIEGHASVTLPDHKYGRTAEQWARAQGCTTPEVALFSTAAQKLRRPRANLRVYNRSTAYPSSKTSPIRSRGSNHRIDQCNVLLNSDIGQYSARSSHNCKHHNTPRNLPSVEMQKSPQRGHFAMSTTKSSMKDSRQQTKNESTFGTQVPLTKQVENVRSVRNQSPTPLLKSKPHLNVSIISNQTEDPTDDVDLNESFSSNLSLQNISGTYDLLTHTESGNRVLKRQRAAPINIPKQAAHDVQPSSNSTVISETFHAASATPMPQKEKRQQHPSICSVNTASRIDLEFEGQQS